MSKLAARNATFCVGFDYAKFKRKRDSIGVQLRRSQLDKLWGKKRGLDTSLNVSLADIDEMEWEVEENLESIIESLKSAFPGSALKGVRDLRMLLGVDENPPL
jgi:hypothetical protein